MRNGKRSFGPVFVVVAFALAGIRVQPVHAKTFNVPCDVAALTSVMATVSLNGEEDAVWLAPSCVYALTSTSIVIEDDGGFPVTIHGRGATLSGVGQRIVIIVSPVSTLFLNGVTVRDGFNTGDGGAIQNLGAATLTDCTVANSEAASGGGIANFDNGRLTLIRTTVSGNTASADGGGIYNRNGRFSLLHSTVSGNAAEGSSGMGAGIYTFGAGVKASLTNTTIFGNASRFGAGIFNDRSALVVSQTTITENTAVGGGNGAGLYNRRGAVKFSNSIIANSLFEGGGYECVLDPITISITPSGTNLIEDGSCNVTGALSVDPRLGALKGAPAHFPLLPGSPAIDAGGNPNCAGADQRGAFRPRDGDANGTSICDLGAYENP